MELKENLRMFRYNFFWAILNKTTSVTTSRDTPETISAKFWKYVCGTEKDLRGGSTHTAFKKGGLLTGLRQI